MGIPESEIRQSVAKNISILDSTLIVLKEEYCISIGGKKAFIDILAKDNFGCFTIIEIKKSNKSARTTIQQMYKYASFLKKKYRVPSSDIRCIILSTVWDELEAPFGEFCKFSSYETKGYKLHYSVSKVPSYEEIFPVFIHGASQPLDNFVLMQYEKMKERNNALKTFKLLKNTIKQLNGVVFSLNLKRGEIEKRDIYSINKYPYAIAWVIYTGNYSEIIKEIKNQNISLDIKIPYLQTIECKQKESKIRSILLNHIFIDNTDCYYQRYAIHSLTNILVLSDISRIIKTGPMFSDSFYNKADILNMSCGYFGLHPYYFKAKTTPRRMIQFNKIRSEVDKFLQVNKRWRKAVNSIFQNLNDNDILQIEIFNPMNIFGLFNDLCVNTQSARIPELVIIIENDEQVLEYRGDLKYKHNSNIHPYEAINRSYPDLNTFKMRSIMQFLNQYDEKLSEQYGLYYELVSLTDETIFDYRDETWIDMDSVRLHSLDYFIKKNTTLILHVGKIFEELGIGRENHIFL